MMRLQEMPQASEIKRISKPKIINCRVSRNKLISQLEDGREISMPVSLLTKWRVLGENVKPEQLKRNEIKGEGNIIYFPDIDEALPTWKIIEGLHTC
ncbi:DUF2442 domain-containing protein [endosymbiont GvMRE of Glomus versiforme]|uniref:DUF2442 domain-containing protein n=1 Tax=endosymbiont GvMRE of Glomus versiforme TaxID=2039283 RepID=UPI000ECD3DA3|nr:DUF2442 domain-containing protein [endosymbiont GvMRE of Glomus versiforme]RHZ36631.1 Conserved protein of unkwnown function (DUF2442 domain) [endosymbiont GvMRE of Glomus versiforme]